VALSIGAELFTAEDAGAARVADAGAILLEVATVPAAERLTIVQQGTSPFTETCLLEKLA
jgi:hypothetical protein